MHRDWGSSVAKVKQDQGVEVSCVREKNTTAFSTLVQASLRLWSRKLSLVLELHRQYRCPFSYSDAAEDAFPCR